MADHKYTNLSENEINFAPSINEYAKPDQDAQPFNSNLADQTTYYQPQPQLQPQAAPHYVNINNNPMVQPQVYQPPPVYVQQPVYFQPAAQVTVVGVIGNLSGLPTHTIGPHPQTFYCTTCMKSQVSSVEYVMGNGSWLWCVGCLFCIPIISCGPCCIQGCQDAIHRCPQCHNRVGHDKFLC